MEFNKIAGAILLTLLTMMAIAKIGNTLVPQYHPLHDKPGAEGPSSTTPDKQEPEKPVAELLATADPKVGQQRANSSCTSCHSFEKGGPNKVGPNLWDVVDRDIASIEFNYSNALKGKPGEWTYADLDAYLTSPKAYAPGTKMSFAGLRKTEERAAVIAYLRSLSDSPKPLP